MYKYIILAISLLLVVSTQAQAGEEYFDISSYQDAYVYFKGVALSVDRPSNPMEHSLLRLATEYISAMDLIREGNLTDSIYHLKKALRAVPEYLHVDIMIALIYEELGEPNEAARYYKAYLQKLQKLHSGFYPISEKFIVNTVGFSIPDYQQAQESISRRLSVYGIDIKNVSPPGRLFLLHPISILVIVAASIFGLSKISSVRHLFFKIKSRLNSSAEAWVCENCGKVNANINVSCHYCQRPNK